MTDLRQTSRDGIIAFLREQCRDADGVLGLLTTHHEGELPQRAAVVKWFRRGSLPVAWAFALLEAVKRERGGYPDLSAYITGGVNDIFS